MSVKSYFRRGKHRKGESVSDLKIRLSVFSGPDWVMAPEGWAFDTSDDGKIVHWSPDSWQSVKGGRDA